MGLTIFYTLPTLNSHALPTLLSLVPEITTRKGKDRSYRPSSTSAPMGVQRSNLSRIASRNSILSSPPLPASKSFGRASTSSVSRYIGRNQGRIGFGRSRRRQLRISSSLDRIHTKITSIPWRGPHEAVLWLPTKLLPGPMDPTVSRPSLGRLRQRSRRLRSVEYLYFDADFGVSKWYCLVGKDRSGIIIARGFEIRDGVYKSQENGDTKLFDMVCVCRKQWIAKTSDFPDN